MEYLAINDWEEYQTDMKNREWIKDSVCQNDRQKFASLSMFERGVLQDLRRVRGRTRMNIENDIKHIALAIHAKVTDRPHLRHAVDTLIARKILILTDQQHSPIEEKRVDKKKEERTTPRKPRGAVSKKAQVSAAIGEPTVQRIGMMVKGAWEENNPGVKCPMADAAWRQVKLLRAKTTSWQDSHYAQCLANLYATEGFPRSELPEYFLPRLPSYFSGPKDRYNRELGNGSGSTKAERRNRDISETTAAVFGINRGEPGHVPKSLPDKTPG